MNIDCWSHQGWSAGVSGNMTCHLKSAVISPGSLSVSVKMSWLGTLFIL
jgi:hypothetical protein